MKLFAFSGLPALKLSALLAVAAVPTVALLPGCGGGGGGSSSPTITQRAGGQISLGNGQFGSVGFARFNTDQVFGTFQITNGPGATPGFPTGTYDVSGRATGNTAVVRGTIPSSSLITINISALPTRTTNGAFTVTIGNQTFTGGTLVQANPTPTATATATSTATPTATTAG